MRLWSISKNINRRLNEKKKFNISNTHFPLIKKKQEKKLIEINGVKEFVF